MSNIAVQGGAGGTGTVTILAPSTSTDRTLTLPDNTGTVVSTASSAVVTPAMLDTQAQYTGFKNRIINGAMVIDQRNAGASVTPTDNQFTVDRWAGRLTQAAKYSVQQNAGAVTPPAGYKNYFGVTSLTSYAVTSGDTFDIQQRIEGFNAADLGWGAAGAATVTLSFWVRSSLTGTFGGVLQNSAFNRSYPYSYTISAANTWEQKTVTIAGDTTGTWLTTNGTGVVVSFGLGNGSTYSGTAGAWVGAGLLNVTGATSVVGTSGATFYITGVQLEKGSTATSFDYRPYGTELALCQRYYQFLLNQLVAFSPDGNNGQNGNQAFRFPVDMRAAPTAGNISVTYRQSATSYTASTVTVGTKNIGLEYFQATASTLPGYSIPVSLFYSFLSLSAEL